MTFRLRLLMLFFLSYSHAAPFFPCNFFNKLPQTSFLGYHLDFLLFKTVCSHFPFVIQTGGNFISLSPFRDSALFCLIRLSDTLNELWVSNSHTR